MQKQIEELKAQCRHRRRLHPGGEEGAGRGTKAQRDYARAAVRAGASLVLGHHSHVGGRHRGVPGRDHRVHLGNFCFGGNTNPRDKDTFIFQQRLSSARTAGSAGGLVIPCSVSGSKGKNDYQRCP